MAEAADPIAGLVAFLSADAALGALLDLGVFGGELPPDQTALMPARAVVIKSSGGVSTMADGYSAHDTQRVDVFGFGRTPHEAGQVRSAAALALRNLRRSVHAGTLLHWAKTASGPIPGREPQTEWPREFQSFQIFHGLEAVT
ncbi:MAG: DUF3168 domain-containing protein [Pseudomonadota bacterium]